MTAKQSAVITEGTDLTIGSSYVDTLGKDSQLDCLQDNGGLVNNGCLLLRPCRAALSQSKSSYIVDYLQ